MVVARRAVQDFNAVEDELRKDPDICADLHQRVEDVRERLWSICDERKEQAERERGALMNNGWLEDRMGLLANLYLSLMQVGGGGGGMGLLANLYLSLMQVGVGV